MTERLEGLIVKDQSGFFWVETPGGQVYICRLRGRLLEEAQLSDVAALGDRVTIQVIDEETGTIESVAERDSVLSRATRTEGNRGAGQAEREQVIIANADQALFVFAAASPPPNFRMLDRFLAAGEASGIETLIIVVNKIDLDDSEAIRERFSLYAAMDYPILYTSAVAELGVEDLRATLADKVSVFTGPSGVGKTSLLNAVQPGLGRSVKSVNAREEGAHTTRDSALVKLDGGGYIADTPGMRTLSLWDIEPEELDGYFVDIAPYVEHCRFRNCSHQSEPGCAVRSALKSGEIAASRYQSYLQLREEVEQTYVYSQ